MFRQALAGFAGGLPVGFFGPGKPPSGDSDLKALAFPGMAVVAAAAFRGARVPTSLRDSAMVRGEIFAKAFIDGYEKRLSSRRRVSAFAGGAIGTVTGVALLLLLFSTLDSSY